MEQRNERMEQQINGWSNGSVGAARGNGFPRWFGWGLLIFCFAGAIFLRLWDLSVTPAGLHLDEAIDVHITQRVLRGDFFFYTSEGWGREGMYYYLAAPLLRLTGDGIWGIRLTSALIGVVLVGLAGVLAGQLFGRDVGLLATAWMGLTFWPVFVSRLGLRNITLPLTLSLAVLAFWWAWNAPRRAWARFGLAGLLLGLCLYTYQPARVAPLVLVAFLGYVALFHRAELRPRRRGLVLGGVVLALTVLPLALFLLRHPAAEGQERADMLAPLDQMLAGNPRPLADNALAIAKMFTLQGDPLGTYNLSHRPIFPGLTALAFYLGVLVCLRRWRDPAHALLGLWLGVMLVPSLLTTSAPHFMRSVGALTPVMVVPALGLAAVVRFLSQRWGARGLWVGGVLALALLGQTAWLTWQGYFQKWAASWDVAVNYNGYETAVVHYMRATSKDLPTVVGARFAEDAAPFVVSSAMFQDPPPIRWVLPGAALVFPVEGSAARFLWETCTPVDDYFTRHFVNPERQAVHLAVAGRLDDAGQKEPWLIASTLRPPHPGAPLPQVLPPQAGPWFAPPGAALPAAHELTPAKLPVTFEQRISLLQYGFSALRLRPGETLRLVTLWQTQSDGWPGNLAMFVHVADSHSQIVAQQDQFGYPVHSWKAGDRVVQIHDLFIDPATPPGRYWVQAGFYERHLVGRWTVSDSASAVTADRLILDQVEVEP
jgi:4-amino-4-deoxy-L-arabinose transferase-like glycosyltransferase